MDGKARMDSEIRAFRRDYNRHGKHNLDIQVPHLARLAEKYEHKYRERGDWTDCLKAHTLYNSCAARQPHQDSWRKRAFEVQKSFWGADITITYADQKKITDKLVSELQTIREEVKLEVKGGHDIVDRFPKNLDDTDTSVYRPFVDKVSNISMSCTNTMINFSKHVMDESVQLFGTTPPCDFSVIAIGSLARGEATPFSDLEYLFLIQRKTPAIVEYFHRLAIVGYFLIGNLCETKLSYMAIDELHGWFDDCGPNGFKIDGLSDGAGNIPTGNGNQPASRLVLTAEELLQQYEAILKSPGNDAMKGDLTAMMTYLREIFVFGESLLDSLKQSMTAIPVNQKRLSANLDMLSSDIRKFHFRPDSDMSQSGYTVNVKKHIFRFPSILLLDLAIVNSCAGESCWSTIQMLFSRGHITESVYEAMRFLLACACYLRLGAYLHYNSHNDKISIAQRFSLGSKSDPGLCSSGQRWSVPQGLYLHLCFHLIPFQQLLHDSLDLGEAISVASLDGLLTTWTNRVTAHMCCGRYTDALRELQQKYGNVVPFDPKVVIEEIVGNQGDDILPIIGETFFWTGHYKSAQIIYNHLAENNQGDYSLRIVLCHTQLDGNTHGVSHLESIESEKLLGFEGTATMEMLHGNYKRAEELLIQTLHQNHEEASKDQLYDYYGDPILTGFTEDDCLSGLLKEFTLLAPADRLSIITATDQHVLHSLHQLGYLYNCQNQFSLAELYLDKCIQMVSEFHGGTMITVEAVSLYEHMAFNYLKLHKESRAEECYLTAIELSTEIHGNSGNVSTIIRLYRGLSDAYIAQRKFHKVDETTLQGLLTLCRNMGEELVDRPSFSLLKEICASSSSEMVKLDAAKLFSQLGLAKSKQRLFAESLSSYSSALELLQLLPSSRNNSLAIGVIQNNVGIDFMSRKSYSDAAVYFKKSIENKIIYNGEKSIDCANTLINLARSQDLTSRSQLDQFESEQTYLKALAIYCELDPSDSKIKEVFLEHNTSSLLFSEFIKISGVGSDRVCGSTASDNRASYLWQIGCYYSDCQMFQHAIDCFKKFPFPNTDEDLQSKYFEYYARALAHLNYHQLEHECTTMDPSVLLMLIDNTDYLHSEVMAEILNIIGDASSDHKVKENCIKKALQIYKSFPKLKSFLLLIGSQCKKLAEYYYSIYEFSEAVDFYRDALSEFDVVYGMDCFNEDVAWILGRLGSSCTQLGLYKESEFCLKRALTLYNKWSLHSKESSYIQRLCGWNLCAWGKHDQANAVYMEILTQFTADQGNKMIQSTIFEAELLNHMALNYREMYEYSNAEQTHLEAIEILRRITASDAEKLSLAQTLHDTGDTFYSMNEIDKAELYFSEALMIYRDVPQAGDTALPIMKARSLFSRGCVYYQQQHIALAKEDFFEAINSYEKASDVLRDTVELAYMLFYYGKCSSDQTKALASISRALVILNDSECDKAIAAWCSKLDIKHTMSLTVINVQLQTKYMAEGIYHQMGAEDSPFVVVFAGLGGVDHTQILDALINLANSIVSTSHVIAKWFHDLSLNYLLATTDGLSKDSSTALLIQNMGYCSTQLGEFITAETLLEKSLEIYRYIHAHSEEDGLNNIAAICEELGNCSLQQGKLKLANEYYLQAQATYDDRGNNMSSKTSPWLRLTIKAYSLFVAENFGEAFKVTEEALFLLNQISEEDDSQPVQARVFMCLGNMSLDMKGFHHASSYFKQAYEIYKRISDDSSNLAHLYKARHCMGLSFLGRKALAEARHAFHDALELITQMGSVDTYSQEMCTCTLDLGETTYRLKEYNLAGELYSQVLEHKEKSALSEAYSQVLVEGSDQTKQNLGFHSLSTFEKEINIHCTSGDVVNVEKCLSQAINTDTLIPKQHQQICHQIVETILKPLYTRMTQIKDYFKAEASILMAIELHRLMHGVESSQFKPKRISEEVSQLGKDFHNMRNFLQVYLLAAAKYKLVYVDVSGFPGVSHLFTSLGVVNAALQRNFHMVGSNLAALVAFHLKHGHDLSSQNAKSVLKSAVFGMAFSGEIRKAAECFVLGHINVGQTGFDPSEGLKQIALVASLSGHEKIKLFSKIVEVYKEESTTMCNMLLSAADTMSDVDSTETGYRTLLLGAAQIRKELYRHNKPSLLSNRIYATPDARDIECLVRAMLAEGKLSQSIKVMEQSIRVDILVPRKHRNTGNVILEMLTTYGRNAKENQCAEQACTMVIILHRLMHGQHQSMCDFFTIAGEFSEYGRRCSILKDFRDCRLLAEAKYKTVYGVTCEYPSISHVYSCLTVCYVRNDQSKKAAGCALAGLVMYQQAHKHDKEISIGFFTMLANLQKTWLSFGETRKAAECLFSNSLNLCDRSTSTRNKVFSEVLKLTGDSISKRKYQLLISHIVDVSHASLGVTSSSQMLSSTAHYMIEEGEKQHSDTEEGRKHLRKGALYILTTLGEQHMSRKSFKKALLYYTDALLVCDDPCSKEERPSIYDRLGKCHDELENGEEAKRCFLKAEELN